MAINQSDAAAVIEAIETLVAPEMITLANDNAIVAVPKGVELKSLKPFRDELRLRPERIVGMADLESLDSFIAHVNRFKASNSAVFANRSRLLAVYDYHHGNSQAEFGSHRAVYTFPTSPEWYEWTRMSGINMTQASFSEFIESRISDVTTPTDADQSKFAELNFRLATPAQLMTLSRGLAVRVESEAVSRPNLSTGEVEVSYKEAHADATGLPLKVPGGFMLLIPPFVNGMLYRIPVRLRYKVASGKVVWSYHMHNADVAIRDAIKDACEKVIDATSPTPLFHGSPENSAAIDDDD